MSRHFRAPIPPTVGAIVLFWLSLTPSLLPRTPFFQALVSAIALLCGYGLGSLLGWVIRGFGGRLTGRRRQLAWRIVAWVGGLGTVVVLWLSLRWENEVRDLVGSQRVGLGHVLLSLVMLAVLTVVLLGIARALKALGRLLGRLIGRVLPAKVATVIGGLVVGFVVYEVVLGVAGGRLLGSLDSTFVAINDEFGTSIPPPTIPEVSAGPLSAAEPRGRDVSSHVFWIPFVTMLQLGAADQMVANDVPAGQGHQFGQEPVYAWAAILPPPGWTPEDTDRLAQVIARRPGLG